MLDTCRKLTGKFWVVVVRMGYSTKPKGFVVVLPAQIGKVWGFAGAWWVGFSCVKIGWPKSHGLQLITVSSLGTLQLEPVNARNDQWRSVNFAVPPPYHHISPYHRRDVWSEGQFHTAAWLKIGQMETIDSVSNRGSYKLFLQLILDFGTAFSLDRHRRPQERMPRSGLANVSVLTVNIFTYFAYLCIPI